MSETLGIQWLESLRLTWAVNSHWHWDHIGDPSSFPPTTNLIVGPGFKKAMLPGFPANRDSPLLESDWA